MGRLQIMRRVLVWLTNTKLYAWLLTSIIPYIRFSLYYPKIRGDKYSQGYRFLQRGSIILTRDNKKLTSLLIGGEFSHAAFCVGESDRQYQIAEMTHTNYTKSWFFDLCKEADRVVILECIDFDPPYIEAMVARCKSFEDVKYDLQFKLDVKALYCSELIYECDFEGRLDLDLEDLRALGRKYISPDGLYHAKNAYVVWDSSWTS